MTTVQDINEIEKSIKHVLAKTKHGFIIVCVESGGEIGQKMLHNSIINNGVTIGDVAVAVSTIVASQNNVKWTNGL